jgi:hypothetical protein
MVRHLREEVVMTLAFYPLGAFLAGAFLGSGITVFALALRLAGRGSTQWGASALPGLVEGFRDWTDRRREPRIPVSPSPLAEPDEPELETGDGPEIVELR